MWIAARRHTQQHQPHSQLCAQPETIRWREAAASSVTMELKSVDWSPAHIPTTEIEFQATTMNNYFDFGEEDPLPP